MEKAALIISIISLLIAFGALCCYIPTAIYANYQRKSSKSSFHFENQIVEDEESGILYSNILCVNFSIEPISVLRIDFIYGEDIQTVGLETLLKNSESTLIPPREVKMFCGIKLVFNLDDLARIRKSNILSESVRVFTTQNNEPFIINLRNGHDDSENIVALKSKKK